MKTIKRKIKLNQIVKENKPNSWVYWVEKIEGNNVLVRTTESKQDVNCETYWFDIKQIKVI